jgi:hypothetical protein
MLKKLLILSLLFSFASEAARTMYIAPISFTWKHSFSVRDSNDVRRKWDTSYFNRWRYGGGAGGGVGIGLRGTVSIVLTNISTVRQTGTLELLVPNWDAEDDTAAGVLARAQSTIADEQWSFSKNIVLCGTGNSDSSSWGGEWGRPLDNNQQDRVHRVRFTIEPQGIITLPTIFHFKARVWEEGPNTGTNVNRPRINGVNFSARPYYRITINEDRGALLGSMTTRISGKRGGTGATRACGVTLSSGRLFYAAEDVPTENSLPMQINGGRPF